MKTFYKIVFFSLLSTALLTAQRPGGGENQGGVFRGTVVVAKSDVPIEYANIVLYDTENTQVTGTITDPEGRFELNGIKPGSYSMELTYIGFEVEKIPSLSISLGSRIVDLGIIKLQPKLISLDGVEVEGSGSVMKFDIDKKIVNVREQRLSDNGNAVDALEHVPSVSVDIEGNVSLRGSSNFTVLIDGVPSILEGSEALEQIPASSIENIEIITNPSAKYDPDGAAGIINVVLRQNRASGMSGLINLSAGTFDNHRSEFMYQSNRGMLDYTVSASLSKRGNPGTATTENRIDSTGVSTYILSEGDNSRSHGGYRIKASMNYRLTDRDILTAGFGYGGRKMERTSLLDYDKWSTDDNIHSVYLSDNLSKRSGDFGGLNLNYLHKFSLPGHEIKAEAIYRSGEMEERTTSDRFDENDIKTDASKSTEDGPSTRMYVKVDYSYPINDKSKVEMGLQSRMGKSEDGTELYRWTMADDSFVLQPEYSHRFQYLRNIHSVYGTYRNKNGKFGWQLGLRGEYALREIEEVSNPDTHSLDRFDIFPSLHLSYNINEEQQIMTSYSRRIDRPRGWSLEPFPTWTDANNIHQGNPDLDPEFTDSFELSWQKTMGRNFISSELYYHATQNKIEFLNEVYNDSVILHTSENIGASYSTGIEMMLDYKPAKFWNLNLVGNVYNYKIDREVGNSDRESSNWSLRLNNIFMLAKMTQLQISTRYNSESVTAQGTSAENYYTDLALKHEFIDGRLSATFEFKDIFKTYGHDFISDQENYYSASTFAMDSPRLTLGISYNFNNYKKERQGMNGESMEEDDF